MSIDPKVAEDIPEEVLRQFNRLISLFQEYTAIGADLSEQIGSGGSFDPTELIDHEYIQAQAGVIGTVEKDGALRLMKKSLGIV